MLCGADMNDVDFMCMLCGGDVDDVDPQCGVFTCPHLQIGRILVIPCLLSYSRRKNNEQHGIIQTILFVPLTYSLTINRGVGPSHCLRLHCDLLSLINSSRIIDPGFPLQR